MLYHHYKAQLPVLIDGKRPTWTFNSDKDVWKVIDLLIQETKEFNEQQGKEFDIESSVQAQLPFFYAKMLFLARKCKKTYKGICIARSSVFPPTKEILEISPVYG